MQKEKKFDELEKDETPNFQLANQGLLKNYSVIFAAIIVILTGVHMTRAILGPILLAIFFTILLISPIKWLRSKGIAPWLSLTSVIIVVIAGGVLVATLAATQLAQFAENIPEYRDRFNETLSNYNIGFKIDEFLPAFLKSDDENKEESAEEGDETSTQGADARIDDLASRTNKVDGEGSEFTPSIASTSHKVAEPTSSLDSNGLNSQENNQAQNAGLFAASANENSLVPPNHKNNGEESKSFEESSLPIPPFIQSDKLSETNVDDADYASTQNDKDEDIAEKSAASRSKSRSTSAVDASSEELFEFLSKLAADLSYFGSNAFIVALMIIFMLCETTNIPKKLISVWGEKKFKDSNIEGVLDDVRNYMIIKTFLSVLVAASATLVLIISKVQYPFLWGMVVFLLEFIPNLGSVISAVPPIILATIDRGLVVGGIDAVCFAAINCFFGYVLEPKLLGDGLNLSPLVVLISLIFFGWLLGPVGMFLSPPLTVVVKIIFQSFPETLWLAALMSENPPTRVADDVQVSV